MPPGSTVPRNRRWSKTHSESRPTASAVLANDRIAGYGLRGGPVWLPIGRATPTFTRRSIGPTAGPPAQLWRT